MDVTYLLILQQLREITGGLYDSLVLHITQLGEPMLTFLLLGFIYWCVDKTAGVYMAINVGVSSTYSQFLKGIFKVERPWVVDSRVQPVEEALEHAAGYSFPSGHTTRGVATWGSLGTFLISNKNRIVGWICWSVAILVGFSRNYLGVHTIWDVMAAFLMTIFFMIVVTKAMKWCEGGKNRDVFVAFIGCLVCFLPMLKMGCLANAGAGIGVWLGWVLERHFVKFAPHETASKKCVCFAIGALGIVYIQTVLSDTLVTMMPAKYVDFFTMFGLMLFITVIYPFFFSHKARYCMGMLFLVLILVVNAAGIVLLTEKTREVERIDSALQEEQESLPIIIAHRGYSSVYPENTTFAIEGAVDIEADMVEFDVQMTSDGVIMVYHDTDLSRIGLEGSIADYTYEEVRKMDTGSAFSTEYADVGIPTLAEIMEELKDSDIQIYLELKDIGDVEGYEESIFKVTEEYGMTSRCIFASFNAEYLQWFKEMNQELQVLYITSDYDETLPLQVDADYYGLNYVNISQKVIDAIHNAGKTVFAWTVDAPADMVRMTELGVDGICTNKPGLARVAIQPEYSFISKYYTGSYAVPGLYGIDVPELCDDMVVQGINFAENLWLVSAYSKTGGNSVLYVLDSNGNWITTVDLGFSAHVGGVAYNKTNGLLWITGSEGQIYAFEWNELVEVVKQGTKNAVVSAPAIKYSFDVGLYNHDGGKVASFMDVYGKRLYVGSYTKGCAGTLRTYDISSPDTPMLLVEQEIPEKIQGMTFVDSRGKQYLLMTQGGHPDDSKLLVFHYNESVEAYKEPMYSAVLPEGAEQIEVNGKILTILFESASRPYYESSRIRNDQIWRLDLTKLIWE